MITMWENLSYFVGTWKGNGSGQPGNSQVERSYQLILNGRFMEVKKKSTYPLQSQNPQGEVHQDLGFFSFDKSRKTYILRQFHIEGFVNKYVLDTLSPDGQAMVFTSEYIENIQAGWR